MSTTKHDDRGRFDRDLNLLLDIRGEVIHIDDPHAAGVHQFEVPSAGFDGVETRSRVTPAVGSTMLIRRPASQLNSDDLPTFGRPTIATIGKT